MVHSKNEPNQIENYLTLRNGILYKIGNETAGKIEVNISILERNKTVAKRYPQEVPRPILKSYKSWQIRDKLYQFVLDLVHRKRKINEVKTEINKDKTLKNYIDRKRPTNTIYEQAKQDNLTEFCPVITMPTAHNILEYLHKRSKSTNLYEIAKEKTEYVKSIEQKLGSTNLEEKVTALFCSDILEEVILKDEKFKTYDLGNKKDRLEYFSTKAKLSKYKIRKQIRELKNDFSREILNYKEKRNLLTYTDLKKMDSTSKIKRIDEIKQIIDKKSYADIARIYHLKNGKVVSKIAREMNELEYSTKKKVYRKTA